MKRPEKWLGGGALAAGVLASMCCLGPLLFAALGLGAFTAGAVLDRFRPVLGLLVVGLGGWGLWKAHQGSEVACEDGTCRRMPAGLGTRVLFWILVLGGLAFFFLPLFL